MWHYFKTLDMDQSFSLSVIAFFASHSFLFSSNANATRNLCIFCNTSSTVYGLHVSGMPSAPTLVRAALHKEIKELRLAPAVTE